MNERSLRKPINPFTLGLGVGEPAARGPGASSAGTPRVAARSSKMVARGDCRDIIVVGASAGGLQALRDLCATLSPDLDAAILVVRHIAPGGPGNLPAILSAAGPLPARQAVEGAAIQRGCIHVAPPDQHLLLDGERMRLRRGPPENRARPAIDPLFRSAAASFAGRTVGVILSGYLNDGTSGLHAIKRCGGLAVVQAPEDAEAPDMPAYAMEHAEVDYILPAGRIGGLLNELARQPAPAASPVPEDVRLEAAIAASEEATMRSEHKLGALSVYSCPDCGGNLWSIEDGRLKRYRCHVGHAYTEEVLSDAQQETVERALWTALRALRERTAMLEQMAARADERGQPKTGARFRELGEDYRKEGETIQALLLTTSGAPQAAE